ncbi:MAG: reverse transcriptase/maturase family protein [Thermoguttaceae bacterium]|nr:reverse transcriptase/maturase family protein [Thermoguttaceae bacterium]
MPNLAEILVDRHNLAAAWHRVSSAEGHNTPGPDGVTVADIAPKADAWLAQLAIDLKNQRYRLQPPRWVHIPKTSDPTRSRRLGILNVRDRVVHTALKQVLEPLLEPLFVPTSFGYRPGLSVPTALAAATRRLAGPSHALPFRWALHLDVADCFDSIDHALLMDMLRHHVADPLVLGLLQQVLAVGGHSVGRFWRPRTCGLVQGSSLSPLLCNRYLHPVDTALSALAAPAGPRIASFRYADDLLLLAPTPRDLRRAVRCVQRELARLRLRLRSPRSAA